MSKAFSPSDGSEPRTVVSVSGVAKKYCRNLHRSLKYGMIDLTREAIGLGAPQRLRPDEFYAVKDLTFDIRAGESVALMGANGAGKSTTLKMLNGLIKPTQGRIRMRGKVSALTTLGAGFKPVLSGRENIYINGAILGFSNEEIAAKIDDMIEFSEIGYAIDDPVKTYSSGMRARLGYSIGAYLEPDILLLDEVFAAGDRKFKLKCFDHLGTLTAKGIAIIVVSHNVGRLTSICKRAIVFDKGGICYDGPSREGLAVYYRVLGISPGGDKKNRTKQQDTGETLDSAPAAWIDSAELLDSEGNPTATIRRGEALRLRIHLQSVDFRDDLRVAVNLVAASGTLSTMKTGPGQLEIDDDGKTIELQLFNQASLKGAFRFAVKLTESQVNNVLHQVEIPFQVTSRSRAGVVMFDHYWSGIDSQV